MFNNNEPNKAIPYFQSAINQDGGNEKSFLYLGYAYEQLDRNNDAIDILTEGLDVAVQYKDRFYLNIGNNYFKLNDHKSAKDMYSQALLVNPGNYNAYLNRANANVGLEEYSDAVDDYRLYLTANPASEQKTVIERVIRILENNLREAELAKEEEERKRIQQEQKDKELLNNILNSLNSISDESTNLSAEREDVIEKETEEDLED